MRNAAHINIIPFALSTIEVKVIYLPIPDCLNNREVMRNISLAKNVLEINFLKWVFAYQIIEIKIRVEEK